MRTWKDMLKMLDHPSKCSWKWRRKKFVESPKAAVAWTSFTACLLHWRCSYAILVDGQSWSQWSTNTAWNYLSMSLCNCLMLRFTAYKHPSILFRTLNTTLKFPWPIFWELRMTLHQWIKPPIKVDECSLNMNRHVIIFRVYLNFMKISPVTWKTIATNWRRKPFVQYKRNYLYLFEHSL